MATIFLASAIRDNGEGKVITTEFDPDKAQRAKRNLTAAGLAEWVEFRVGDALETLSNPPREIDMIFLDGAKELYLDVLKLLEPHLRPLGIIASDNTIMMAWKPSWTMFAIRVMDTRHPRFSPLEDIGPEGTRSPFATDSANRRNRVNPRVGITRTIAA